MFSTEQRSGDYVATLLETDDERMEMQLIAPRPERGHTMKVEVCRANGDNAGQKVATAIVNLTEAGPRYARGVTGTFVFEGDSGELKAEKLRSLLRGGKAKLLILSLY